MDVELPHRHHKSDTVVTLGRTPNCKLVCHRIVGALVLLTLMAGCSEPAGEEGWRVGSEDNLCGQAGERLSVDEVAEFHGCTVFLGSLSVLLREESDLRVLPPLRVVEGRLIAWDNIYGLRSLDGLEHLERVGGQLKFQHCKNLESLSVLSRLDQVGRDLIIISNNSLPDLQGLEGLRTVGGELSIQSNLDLWSLGGLDNLESVAGNLIIGRNDLLTSLSGLSNLEQIGGRLSVFVNPMLTSFDGLEKVSTLSELNIQNNRSLQSLEGLSGLRRVRGDVRITNNENLPQSEIDALLARIQVDGEVILD